MAFEEFAGVVAANAAAVEAETDERERPTFCPVDGTRLRFADGPDGLEAVCDFGDYRWP